MISMPTKGGKHSLLEDLEKLLETARTIQGRYDRRDGIAIDEITHAGLRVLWKIVLDISALHNAMVSCKSEPSGIERELKLRPVGSTLGSTALPLLERVIEARDLPGHLKRVAKEAKGDVKERDATTIANAVAAATSPRVLDLFRYEGYACIKFDEETRSSADNNAGTVMLHVWLQKGSVETGIGVRGERIEISEGKHVDPVPFEIVIDSDTLEVEPLRKPIFAPQNSQSGEVSFDCRYREAGVHDLWVQFNQQNRLIQVVKATFDTQGSSIPNS
jgi:hypothetical protein